MTGMNAAIPTRYRGVLYRSKSEAKLAVCLDAWGHTFAYEPNDFSIGGWTPDFLVTHESGLRRLIEYKPCIPNGEYINTLADRFGSIIKMESRKLICELWCVDFWLDEVNGLRFKSETEIQVIDETLSYLDFSHGNRWRFDLC